MRTFGSVFSGGGLVEAGAIAAGFKPVFAVEHDADAAASYTANYGDHCRVANVQDVDPRTLPPVEVLWASPPCPDFSQARDAKLPSRGEERLALACIPYLEVLRPRIFFLENVPTFATKGRAILAELSNALYGLGYTVDHSNVNSADYGVPQTRSRFILRAVLGELLPALPAPVPWIGWYAAIEDMLHTLPESRFAPWQLKRLENHPIYGSIIVHPTEQRQDTSHREGWPPAFTVTGTHGMARALLVPDFNTDPRESFATAQTILAGHSGPPKAFLCSGGGTDGGASVVTREVDEPSVTITGNADRMRGFLMSNAKTEWSAGVRQPETPAFAVTGETMGRSRAFLVDGQNAGREITARVADEPSFTVPNGGKAYPRAYLVDCKNTQETSRERVRDDVDPSFTVVADNRPSHAPRALFESGRVVSMTPRALARFQSLPDSYVLPAKRATACRIIGNGVPSLLVQRLLEGFRP